MRTMIQKKTRLVSQLRAKLSANGIPLADDDVEARES